MSDPYHWMPLVVGDYLKDTTALSTEEHGAYLLLIMAYWNNHGPLPDDEKTIQRITRLTACKWKKISPILKRFFEIKDGKWTHSRIDKELVRARDKHARRFHIASAGGKASANKRRTDSTPSAHDRSTTTPHYTKENISKKEESLADLPAELPPRFPKTEKEVSELAALAGVPLDFALATWHKAVSRGGRDAKDVPIRSFRGLLAVEYGYQRSREAEVKARETQERPAPTRPGKKSTSVWDINPYDCI